MRKLIFLLTLMFAFVFDNVAMAEDVNLFTSLHKTFRATAYPREYKMVGIKIVTRADHLPGNRESAEFERARKIHKMLVFAFNRIGWKEDALATDDIVSKDVEVVIGEGLSFDTGATLRLKAFNQQCSAPMKKYRGGDLNDFFSVEVVAEAEYCVSYDNRLEQ